jgi:enoyl-CoA hydratase/carnithine racemase
VSTDGVEAERIGMINYTFPREELEARTIAFADRIADMTADHLAIIKVNTNRFYENMGLYCSVRSSTDQDFAGQFMRQVYAWQNEVRAGNRKVALDWRDGPYRDYRAKAER